MVNIHELLKRMAEERASDMHIKVGNSPILRVDNKITFLTDLAKLTPEDTFRIAYELMSDEQRRSFEQRDELDFSFGEPGIARFRVNAFRSRGAVQLAVRIVPYDILDVDALKLPKTLMKLVSQRRGLVLVTGPTGSGKSTSLAAIVHHINCTRSWHVITIEDPIEFIHKDIKSIITQREVGMDTKDFHTALSNVFREDPDVVMIGEMRDPETLHTALVASETGHLVLGTLHTSDAISSIARYVGAFPDYQQRQIRSQLSSALQGIVGMRLVPFRNERGLVPAVEILVATPYIRELIQDSERTNLILEAMEKGQHQGMQTFDMALAKLVEQDLITYEDALSYATSPKDFARLRKGIS